jgi:hypothetical protein
MTSAVERENRYSGHANRLEKTRNGLPSWDIFSLIRGGRDVPMPETGQQRYRFGRSKMGTAAATFDPMANSDKMPPGLKLEKAAARRLMRWFRDNVRHGSWLALLALVVNLGLSFGHFHAADGKRLESGLISLVAAVSSGHDRAQGHPGDNGADDLCPVCAAVSALASVFASAPPVLPVVFVGFSFDQSIESILVFDERSPAAFQSRGPPIS